MVRAVNGLAELLIRICSVCFEGACSELKGTATDINILCVCHRVREMNWMD